MSSSEQLNNSEQEADIAIVGGGMVGLSLALMLAKQNLSARIVLCDEQSFSIDHDQHFQPSFDDRSTAISAGSAALLGQLGVWPCIAKYAQQIDTVKVSDRGYFGFTEYNAKENAGHTLGWVVENRCLGVELKKAVDAENRISTRAPAKVKAITPVQRGMQLALLEGSEEDQSTTTLRVSLLILADGANSPLATSLGIGFERHEYKQHALIANVAHSEPHNGVAFEHFTESGPVAFLPLQAVNGLNRSAVVWTHADNCIDEVLNCSDDVFIKKLQSQFGHRLGDLVQVGKRAAYSLNLLSANEQIRRNLALVGNAAHFLHPVAGQGFNLALRDCAALVNCLTQGKKQGRELGELTDLQAYMQAREIDQWLTTEMSHNFISMFTSSHTSKRVLRTSGLSLLNKMPAIKSLFFRQMMGQGLNGVSLR